MPALARALPSRAITDFMRNYQVLLIKLDGLRTLPKAGIRIPQIARLPFAGWSPISRTITKACS